jgi:TPP-dependent pyruvate/acetoin dehydrogenase alpha subunit
MTVEGSPDARRWSAMVSRMALAADVDRRPQLADPRLVGRDDESDDARWYRRMRCIRHFEETLLSLFDEGILNGTTHCCIGQEADSVGVIEHLRPDDHVFSNHRCHGHFLARTGNAIGLLAEIMGKPEGVCFGTGGSQHLCAPGFKSNGVQGGIVPAAAGIAMANQLSGTDALSLVFIGDGTLGEGAVYETLNIASLWNLPLVVVLEDNGWSQSTPSSVNLAGDVVARFEAFGIATTEVATTDVREIHAAAGDVIGAARATGSPQVLVIRTYRLCHHSKNDDNRPAEEVAARWVTEPLRIHGERLAGAERDAIDEDVRNAIDDVVDHVRQL